MINRDLHLFEFERKLIGGFELGIELGRGDRVKLTRLFGLGSQVGELCEVEYLDLHDDLLIDQGLVFFGRVDVVETVGILLRDELGLFDNEQFPGAAFAQLAGQCQ